MAEEKPQPIETRLAELEAENSKLRKINQVLIQRVEAGTGQVATPYAAFEHSVSLAELVRERTDELNQALEEIRTSHKAISRANLETAVANQRLGDAIESISDAFVLFDTSRRVILFNSKFASIWIDVGIEISRGIKLAELDALAYRSGLIARVYPATDSSAKVYLLANGRWIQMSERPTAEGGLVILYTDISELMARESEQREFALEQQSQLMKRTIDNLSQGVVLVDRYGLSKLWNRQFLQLTGISPERLQGDITFQQLIRSNRALQAHSLQTRRAAGTAESIYHNPLGQVLEIKSHPLPDGSSVYTFSDITERFAYEESLRQSEQWIRLITDNVPAMIAFIGPDRCYRFTNRGYEHWHGVAPGLLIGQSIDRQINTEGSAENREPIANALAGSNQTFEIWEVNADGERRYLLKTYVANIDAQGRPDGFFVMNRDITERHQYAEELEKAVIERTTALTQLNSELELAKQQADQANLSKTKFLAAVSHDLLQPLNAARLFTASLEEKSAGSPTETLATSISSSLDDVEGLLRTLVDISKLDAGVVQAKPTPFPANQLLNNLATEFRQVAQAKNLRFDYDDTCHYIESDSQLLARILRNLLTNAIRYTPSGGIRLRARPRGDQLVIQVWDSGPGIHAQDRQSIFEEFKRLKGADKSTDKGLGLGLAIVDKLSRVLAHPIDLKSRVGRGSMFSVQVPIVQAAQQDRVADQQDPVQIAISPLQGTRIWLIDNDPAICAAMTELLTNWGACVQTAAALTELAQQVEIATDPLDLLIVDYHLDDNQIGTDAAAQILARRTRAVPVLMITANYSADLNQQIRERGFHLMNKPVKPLKLKTLLTHLTTR